MQNIADALSIPFTGVYKPAIPKDNIMFQDGTTITLDEANLESNINKFAEEINARTNKLIRVLKK